jgi:alpha/beta superfamily hydrolase
VNYLKIMGYRPVMLAGYSFGAWVSSKISMSDDVSDDISGVIMVSPPISEMEFDFEYSRVDLVITGDSDPFCPLDSLAGFAAAHGFKVAVVPWADHFYFGKELELIKRLKNFIKMRSGE